jgi:RHS repeat-associated protein
MNQAISRSALRCCASLLLLVGLLFAGTAARSQCSGYLQVSRISPSGLLCSPQEVTLRAQNSTYYNAIPNFTGYVRWYTQPSGGTPVKESYVHATYGPTYSDYSFYASPGSTVYVSFYSSSYNCETPRMSYSVPFNTVPVVNVDYAKSCGQGTAEIQVSSATSGMVYALYRSDFFYGGSNYQQVQSNTTGYFQISGFDAANDRYRYAVKATQSYGCPSDFKQVTVSMADNTPPTVSGNQSICQGGQTTLTASGNTPQFKWYDASNNFVYQGAQLTIGSNLPVGSHMYYVYGITADGCQTTPAHVTVNVNPKAEDSYISASATTICVGQSVTITSSGGVGAPYYWCSTDGGANWNIFAQSYGGQTSFVHTPTVAGTYRYHVRNQGSCGFCWDFGGCGPAQYVDVTVVNMYAPSITFISPANFCTTGSVTLRAQNPPHGFYSNSNFTGYIRWYTTATGGTPVAQNAVTQGGATYGDYTFSATNGTKIWASFYSTITGCESERNEYTLSFGAKSTVSQTYARSCDRGSAEVQASSAGNTIELYKYNPSTGAYQLLQSNTSGTFTITSFTTSDRYYYYVRSVPASGCPSDYLQLSFEIASNAAPSVSGTTTFCEGSQTTLTASGGHGSSYKWYYENGTFIQDGAQFTIGSAMAPGTNKVLARSVNAYGCLSEPATVTLTVTPKAVNAYITASATTICVGQPVTISSSGGVGTPYYWCSSDGGATWNVFAGSYGGQSSFVHTPTTAGTYRYHVYNQTDCGFCWAYGGCTQSHYVDVNVVNMYAPTITFISPANFCTTGSVTLRAQNPPHGVYSNSNFTGYIRWYTTATGGTPVAQNAVTQGGASYGDYTFTATQGTKMWASFYSTITNCESGRNEYTISYGAKASITQTYARSCNRGSAEVQASSPGNTIELAKYNPSNGVYTVLQSNTTGAFTISAFTAGERYYYYVRSIPASGCPSDYLNLNIDVASITAPTVSGTTAFCQGGQTTLTASGNGNTYKWYYENGTFLQDGAQLTIGSTLAAGTHKYVVKAINANNCLSDPTTVTLTVHPKPVDGAISASATTICLGQSVTISSSGGVGTPYYWCSNNGGSTWNIFAQANGGAASFTHTPTAPGVYRYLVRRQTGCGFCYDIGNCTGDQYVDVTVASIPSVPVISGNNVICQDGQTTLTASGNASTYRWYNETSGFLWEGANYTVGTGIAPGTYNGRVYGVNGGICLSSPAITTLTVNPKPVNGTITASATSICLGQSVTISSSGGVGTPYYWCSNNGGATWNIFAQSYGGQGSFVHTPTVAGTYRYAVYNQTACGFCQSAPGGCANHPYVTVTVNALPTVSVSLTRSPLDPADVTLTASTTTGTYQWQLNGTNITGATARTFKPLCAGSYRVISTSTAGCSATSSALAVTATDVLTYNFIRTWEAFAPETNPDVLVTRPLRDVKQNTTYYDGLGRPVQNVGKQVSQGKDVVTMTTYDSLGRESLKYLPYAATTSDGNYKTNAFSAQPVFLQTYYAGQAEANFYSRILYEATPMNRIIEEVAPGKNWAGATRGVETQRLANTAADSVKRWIVTDVTGNFGNYAVAGNYAASNLFKEVTLDENGKQKVSYTDKEGRRVLEKRQHATAPSAHHTGWLCVYYVYDDMGQLRAVIQPKAVDEMATSKNWVLDSVRLNHMVFRFEYDGRGRTTMKKVPGSDPVYMVYDARDRQVMTQDGELRLQNKWHVTLYDPLNRQVKTGLLSNTFDGAGKTFAQHQTAAASSTAYPFATEPSSTYWELLTENHFDDYAGLPAGLGATLNTTAINTANFIGTHNASPDYARPMLQSNATLNKVTWVRSKVTGTSQFVSSVNIYDEQGGLLQVQELNHTGGLDITTTQYNFTGKVLRTQHVHRLAGTSPQTFQLAIRMTYDDLWRDTRKEIKLNDSAWKTISAVTYDAVGQVQKRELGTVHGTGLPLETLNMEYNVRGWLLGVNRRFLKDSSNNYFGFELGFDKNGTLGTFVPTYNGNISGTIWKSAGDGEKRKYDFTYDAASRLTGADFNQFTSGSFNKNMAIDYSLSNLTYDASGNILTMDQKGWKITGSDFIDRLAYSYNGNQLLKVTDAVSDPNTKLGDFRDGINTGNDYTYDVNGNLTSDQNKDLRAITYNYQGLPQTVAVNSKGTVKYTYNAERRMLKKEVTDSTTSGKVITTTTEYVGPFVYESRKTLPANTPNDDYVNRLQFISHDEGRIRFVPATASTCPPQPDRFVYDYFIRDHLGNVRMVLTEQQQDICYPQATVEDARVNGPAGEKQYYDITDARRIDKSATPASSVTSFESKIYRTHGALANEKTGLGIVLKVMSGDKVKIKAESFYSLANGDPASVTGMSLSELLTRFLSSSPVKAGKGTVSTTQLAMIHNNTSDLTNFLGRTPPANQAKAYLNWILFDEQLRYVTAGSDPVLAGGGYKLHSAFINSPVNVTKNGYLYVFVSNESNLPVYFDNLAVTHTPGPILEETHYYPFGLTMAGLSSKALNFGDPENKKKFNKGSEFQNKEFGDGSGLEWYATDFRSLDPQLGRWWQIDPKPDYEQSLYSAMGNNPVLLNDPLGDTVRIAWRGGFWGNKKREVIYHNGKVTNPDGSAYQGRMTGFLGNTVRALDKINGTTEGAQVVSELQSSTHNFTFRHANQNPEKKGRSQFIPNSTSKAYAVATWATAPGAIPLDGTGGNIYWDTKGYELSTVDGLRRSPVTDLAHEMFHAYEANKGMLGGDDPLGTGLERREYRASYFENQIRKAIGEPYRTIYNFPGPLGKPRQAPLLDAGGNPINVPPVSVMPILNLFRWPF